MSELARLFAARFQGLGRAYGRYEVVAGAQPDERGKLEGRRWTVREPLTEELWSAHLEGRMGVGVPPARDDGTCLFGAIDVDTYPLDLPALERARVALGLSLVVCRTKSGGAHLYVFFNAPAPCELVRARLARWAALLGYPGAEVFPKQARPGEDGTGNWINMPYQGGERTLRYALGAGGEALGPGAFLELAAQRETTPEALAAWEGPAAADVEGGPWEGAPPCLATLAVTGFPAGTRNNAMFDVAVYLKRRYGKGWLEHAAAYNARYFDPPLGPAELAVVLRSAGRRQYGYRCRETPISAVCDRPTCLTRAHGVGRPGARDPGVELGGLAKLNLEPPLWLWEVGGSRLELTTADLMDQRRFQARAIEVLGVWPAEVKPGRWRELVAERLAVCEVVEVPEDATRGGQLWEHLGRFCTSRVVARTLDEVLLQRPYTAEGRSSFVAADFLAYLSARRVPGVGEAELWAFLRDRGAEHRVEMVKGKRVPLWSVPAFSAQTEPHEAPRASPGEM